MFFSSFLKTLLKPFGLEEALISKDL